VKFNSGCNEQQMGLHREGHRGFGVRTHTASYKAIMYSANCLWSWNGLNCLGARDVTKLDNVCADSNNSTLT